MVRIIGLALQAILALISLLIVANGRAETQVPPGTIKSAAGFYHPGILVNRAQLDFVKAKIAADAEPWKSAFEAARNSDLGSLDYLPHPWKTCECGPFSRPDLGCKDEQHDSEAAYTQALLWYFTGNNEYARNAIHIMDAWADTLKGGHIFANGPVQAAWCGEQWPRAAEIIRYTCTNWPDADIAKFQDMLVTQYLPYLTNGDCENGNKELSMTEALVNIGVFNDDRKTFDLGLKMWRGRTPAYIYLSSDGPTPQRAPDCDEMPIWGNKGLTTPFVDGLLQESVRDSQHANLALAAMVNAAETARQQGVDLYSEQARRIMAALEFQARCLPPNHGKPPANVIFHPHPTWEIAYNEYHDRMGYSLTNLAAVLPNIRPTGVNHQMAWETLTHAGVGSIGLPPLTAP